MKSSETKNLCSTGGDMLAYLYNEMESVDRQTFEVHLASCGTCIDDFAELSQSRYPVFEWKQLEFDRLPTPRVVIPFEVTASISWFDKMRSTFSFRPAVAFGGVGAVMMVTVIAAYLILAGASSETEVAREIEPVASPTRTATALPSQPLEEIIKESVIESDKIAERDLKPKVVKASASGKPPASKPKPAQQPKRNDPVPVMSSIEDDEDDSLRLADIFEEIGTSE